MSAPSGTRKIVDHSLVEPSLRGFTGAHAVGGLAELESTRALGQESFFGVAPSRRGVVVFSGGYGIRGHQKFTRVAWVFDRLGDSLLAPVRKLTERILTAIKYDSIYEPRTGEHGEKAPSARQRKAVYIVVTVALALLVIPYALLVAPVALALLCKGVAYLGNRNMAYSDRSLSAPEPFPAEQFFFVHSNNVGGLPDISALNRLAPPEGRGRKMAQAIVAMPAEVRPLVYCMQECFDTRMRNAMQEEFAAAGNLYPYCLSEVGCAFGRLSSGLVIFSQFPMTHAMFRAYTGSAKFDENLAEKGYLLARVDLGNGQGLYLANTHMQGNDRHTLDALEQYLDASVPRRIEQTKAMLHDLGEFRRALCKPDEAAREIVCGDFNAEIVSGRYGLPQYGFNGIEQNIDWLQREAGAFHPYRAVERFCDSHGIGGADRARCLQEFQDRTGILAPLIDSRAGAEERGLFTLRRKIDLELEDRFAHSFVRNERPSDAISAVFEDPSQGSEGIFGTDVKDNRLKKNPEDMVGDCEAFFEFKVNDTTHLIPFGTIKGQKKIDFILVNRLDYAASESRPRVSTLYGHPEAVTDLQKLASSIHQLTDHETLRAELPPFGGS